MLYLFLTGIPVPAGAQTPDGLLQWTSDSKLQPADFQLSFDSLTTPFIYLKNVSSLLDLCYYVQPYTGRDTEIRYVIYPLFYKKASWLRDTALLRHEQCHFDISELYARLMRKLVIESAGDLRYAALKAALEDLYFEHSVYQKQYDRETNYGAFLNMQILWNNRVATGLDSTKSFTGSENVLKVHR